MAVCAIILKSSRDAFPKRAQNERKANTSPGGVFVF